MRTSHGFTLIELLIVIVIIGILAMIAVPQYSKTKERAYVSAMKTDLRNLASAQEAYFVDYYTYTSSVGSLEFNTSKDVTISLPVGTIASWRATASHIGAIGVVCELYYGNTTGTTATQEGLVTCS
jgi:prepilin-type N-terminal cleavage/methylation domain-containing protein